MNATEAQKLIDRVEELRKENFNYQSQIMQAVQRMNHNALELANLADSPLYSVIYSDRAAKENA